MGGADYGTVLIRKPMKMTEFKKLPVTLAWYTIQLLFTDYDDSDNNYYDVEEIVDSALADDWY